jgi:hypothetical protein
MQKIEEMTLEEKIDELLKFQRRQRIYGIIRVVFNVLLFIIIVVLPIWGVYWTLDYLKNTAGIDFTHIGDTLKNVKTVTDVGANGINSLSEFMK